MSRSEITVEVAANREWNLSYRREFRKGGNLGMEKYVGETSGDLTEGDDQVT